METEPFELHVIARGPDQPLLVVDRNGSVVPLSQVPITDLVPPDATRFRFSESTVSPPPNQAGRLTMLTEGRQTYADEIADAIADLAEFTRDPRPGALDEWGGRPYLLATTYPPGEGPLDLVIYSDENGELQMAQRPASGAVSASLLGDATPLRRPRDGQFTRRDAGGRTVPVRGLTVYRIVRPHRVDLAARHTGDIADIVGELSVSDLGRGDLARHARVYAVGTDGQPVSFVLAWRNGELVSRPPMSAADLGRVDTMRYQFFDRPMAVEPHVRPPQPLDAPPHPSLARLVRLDTAYLLTRDRSGLDPARLGPRDKAWTWAEIDALARQYFEGAGLVGSDTELRVNLLGQTGGRRPESDHAQLAIYSWPDQSGGSRIVVEHLDPQGVPLPTNRRGAPLIPTPGRPGGVPLSKRRYDTVAISYHAMSADDPAAGSLFYDPALYASTGRAPVSHPEVSAEDLLPPRDGFGSPIGDSSHAEESPNPDPWGGPDDPERPDVEMPAGGYRGDDRFRRLRLSSFPPPPDDDDEEEETERRIRFGYALPPMVRIDRTGLPDATGLVIGASESHTVIAAPADALFDANSGEALGVEGVQLPGGRSLAARRTPDGGTSGSTSLFESVRYPGGPAFDPDRDFAVLHVGKGVPAETLMELPERYGAAAGTVTGGEPTIPDEVRQFLRGEVERFIPERAPTAATSQRLDLLPRAGVSYGGGTSPRALAAAGLVSHLPSVNETPLASRDN
ncbi:MAG: hypothetical protein ACRCYQ_13380, partial [Nocardioides sp.]